jgi:dihydroxyacetone kinase
MVQLQPIGLIVMALQKHLLNDPSTLVLDSLQGLLQVNHQLSLDSAHKIVYRSNVDKSKVHIICGGGAGHEPSHAGFVGSGILSAAVSGNIFASPNPTQVRRGIELVDNNKGTIIIVKNYTGDILNFGLAKEKYAAEHPDKAAQVKFLVIGDDVAVGRTQGSIVGRRGLAGVVLVYKTAGALAEQGADLHEVFTVAEYVASRVGTIGIGLEHCHVPGTAVSESRLDTTEVEIGLGIHNEPGNKRIPLGRLDDLIPQLIDLVANTSDTERGFLPFQNDGQDEVVLLVNNLGGMSELELSGVVSATQKVLQQRKIKVARVLSGSFMTSLNMPGFSLTLLLLPRAAESAAPSKELLLSLLDAKAETPGWKWNSSNSPSSLQSQAQAAPLAQSSSASSHSPIKATDPGRFVSS